MPIATCPACRHELDVPAELYSGTVRCGNCMTPFEPSTSLLTVPTVRTAQRVPPRRTGPLSRTWLWVLMAGCSLIALTCIGSCLGLVKVWSNPPFKPFNAADGSYTAVFPGDPLPIVRQDGEGHDLVGVEVSRDFPEEHYFVEYREDDDGGAKKKKLTPQMVIDAWVRRNSATVMGRDAVKSHHGFDASEATGQISLTQGNFVIRAIQVGDRIYLIGITGGVMPNSGYADRYLDGFRPKGAKVEEEKP